MRVERRLPAAVLVVLLATVTGHAFHPPASGQPHLRDYLALQRQRVPRATVVGGFDDWRPLSKYRAHAGLHLGYDVALPAGAPAVAGWNGVVTRIVTWYGPECGISVLSPSGYETTYGHLRPAVAVGDAVAAGGVVGTVVVDHVDVKMRGPDGIHHDFGKDRPAAATRSHPGSTLPRLSRAEALRNYLRIRYSIELTREEAERVAAAERVARDAVRANDSLLAGTRRWLERAGQGQGVPRDVQVTLRDLSERWRRRGIQSQDVTVVLQRAERELEKARRTLEGSMPAPRSD